MKRYFLFIHILLLIQNCVGGPRQYQFQRLEYFATVEKYDVPVHIIYPVHGLLNYEKKNNFPLLNLHANTTVYPPGKKQEFFTLFSLCQPESIEFKMPGVENEIIIKKTIDFEISGDGTAENWQNTNWINIPKRTSSVQNYFTKAKLLYSETGIYVLFSCEDKKLTATMQSDFLDLWNEDVVEIFLQPDEHKRAYLEYEISPLGYELPIIIYNEKGKLNSWQPFHYDPDRKTRHATTVQGGEKKSNSLVKSWTAEIYIPYKLMKPVLDKLPSSGTHWKGNFFRVDYDNEKIHWSWQLTNGNFHEYDKFGSFQFE